MQALKSSVCNTGIENCKASCENELEYLKEKFRECFSIQEPHTIDSVLEQAQNPANNQDCWEQMKEVSEKYKKQSLNQSSLLQEELKAKDIVDCDSIKKSASRQNLNNLALSVCWRAQSQQQMETQQAPDQQTKQAEQTTNPESGSRLSTLLGAEAMADVTALSETTKQTTSPAFNEKDKSSKSLFSEDISEEEQIQKDELYAGFFSDSKQEKIRDTSTNQTEDSKGFVEKSLEKGKLILKKGIDFVKDILPFMDSEKEIIAKAEQLCLNNSPLIQLRQTVYQSVKAPQAERLDEENKRPFDNYDLLQDKPAGVILRIKKSLRSAKNFKTFDFDVEKTLEKIDFSLSLKIDGEEYNDLVCSKNLSENSVNYKSDPFYLPKETTIRPTGLNCFFQWSDFRDQNAYKFMPLPMKPGQLLGEKLGKVNVEISSQWKPKNSIENKFIDVCESSEKFTVNMIEPQSFKILMTGLKAPFCGEKDANKNPVPAFTTTKPMDIKKYLKSTEIVDFYRMFPVGRRLNKPKFQRLLDKGGYVFPIASCDNDKNGTGIYLDAANLNQLNVKYGGDRIVAVFSKNYLIDHHEKYVKKYGKFAGYSFTYVATKYFPLPDFLGGKVLFGSESNTGVTIVEAEIEGSGILLHELAHSFGQLKEHYPPKKHQKQYYCSQFTSLGELPGDRDKNNQTIGIPCQDYRVTGGLVRVRDIIPRNSNKPREQVWKLLNNQYSIMDEIPFVRRRGKYNLWIDRETYNKALATVKNSLTIPEDFLKRIKWQSENQEPRIIQVKQKFESLINCSFQKRPVITVFGIYSKKNGKNPLTHFSAKAFEIEHSKNLFPMGKFFIRKRKEETNHIRVQLKKHGKLEEEVVFSRDNYMEFFYKSGEIKRQEMENFPLFARFFPACGSFDKENYRISVKEVYRENGIKRGETLIDSARIKWENKSMGVEI